MTKNKKYSVVIDFEFEEKETPDKGYGISEKVAHKVDKKKIAYVLCPLCGMNRKLNKSGKYYLQKMKISPLSRRYAEAEIKLERGELIKSPRSKEYNPEKLTSFLTYDLENAPFISLRESGGRASGFVETEIIRIQDIPKLKSKRNKEIFLNLIKEIREQCKQILEYTEGMVE